MTELKVGFKYKPFGCNPHLLGFLYVNKDKNNRKDKTIYLNSKFLLELFNFDICSNLLPEANSKKKEEIK
jgi:hypothetical protein